MMSHIWISVLILLFVWNVTSEKPNSNEELTEQNAFSGVQSAWFLSMVHRKRFRSRSPACHHTNLITKSSNTFSNLLHFSLFQVIMQTFSSKN